MHLLMNNAEVPQHRIASPPAEALEAVCQLFGLPFRHEKRAGVFAVHPPLLGRRIIIRSFAVDGEASDGLSEQVTFELRLLERLLWVSGADVTLLLSQKTPVEAQDKIDESVFWDLALYVYPGQAVPGRINPLVLYSWWHSPMKSRSLAGCIERGCKPGDKAGDRVGDTGFRRASTMRMAKELKNWYYRALSQTRAPAVLLSIPLVDGYVESFLDRLSLKICDGILRFFRKQPVPPETSATLRLKSVIPESHVERRPAVVVSPDHRQDIQEIQERQEKQETEERQETEADKPDETAPPVTEKPSAPPKPQSTEPQSLLEKREAAIVMAQQARARQARPTASTPTDVAGTSESRATFAQKQGREPPRLYGYSVNVSSLPRQAQKAQQDAVQEMEEMRRLLVEAPDLARKRAEEILVNKRIKPTKALLDEYVEYLKRMLLNVEGDGGGEA